MAPSWKEWTRSDIVYGIVVPVVVVLLIVGFSQLGSLLGRGSFGFVMGITSGIAEAIVIVGVPMLLGLAWNQWAGGCSGFLLGSIYALWWAVKFGAPAIYMGLNTSLLGYVVSAMLIGYMAGALNKRSESFLRMVISGIVAGAIGEILLFWIFQLSPSNVVRGLYGFSVTFLPRIACGILMPIIVKVFMSVMSTF